MCDCVDVVRGTISSPSGKDALAHRHSDLISHPVHSLCCICPRTPAHTRRIDAVFRMQRQMPRACALRRRWSMTQTAFYGNKPLLVGIHAYHIFLGILTHHLRLACTLRCSRDNTITDVTSGCPTFPSCRCTRVAFEGKQVTRCISSFTCRFSQRFCTLHNFRNTHSVCSFFQHPLSCALSRTRALVHTLSI